MGSEFEEVAPTNRWYLFLAPGIRAHAQEQKKAHEIPHQELLGKIDNGDISDGGLVRLRDCSCVAYSRCKQLPSGF